MDTSHEDGYTGPLTLVLAGRPLTAQATMRGYFEPLDGHYHWYGRVAVHDELTRLVPGRAQVEVRTPEGTAHGEIGDVDTWGRFRVAGTGKPPFAYARTLADVE